MKQPFEDHTEKQILRTAQKTKETKPARAGRQPSNWRLMLHVCGVAVKIFTLIFYLIYLFGKYGEIRNSCLLYVKSRNESSHVIFWSLETLTGLRYRVM
jgi:magnesium-transporting ATPase (P-type)